MKKSAPHPLFKLATELGPLVIFFAANAKFGLFVATGAFMVAIVVAIEQITVGVARRRALKRKRRWLQDVRP